jgi:hypothetical protein
MKKIVMIVVIAFNGLTANAQLTKEILLKDIYKDASTLKLKDTVVEVPNKSKKEIKDLTKNYLSTVFNNLSKVTSSETDDIIVLNYNIIANESISMMGIVNTVKTMYNIRTEIKFKDGKIKVEMYDSGNGVVISGDGSIIKQPYTFHLDEYFLKGVIKPIDMTKKKSSEVGYRTANIILNDINGFYNSLIKSPFETKTNNW